MHKSWGAGKVTDWDLFGGKVTIDFERAREPQTMGLKLAIQKTEPLEADDFRAERVAKMGELRALAANDPAELIVRMLQSHGGSLKPDAVDKELCGTVVPEEDYKKWWDKAKKIAREGGRVVVPSKRTEPLVLRDENMSPLESLVEEFRAARDLKTKINVLDSLKNETDGLKEEGETLQGIANDIDESVKKGIRLNLGQALDLLACRDELFEVVEGQELADGSLRIQDALLLSDGDVAEEVTSLAAARQRRIYEAFPAAYGDEWLTKLMSVFEKVGTRGVNEIAKMLLAKGQFEPLLKHIKKGISLRTLSGEALMWICRERTGNAEEVFSTDVGFAMLSVIEAGAVDDGPRKGTRLQNLLMDDKKLIADLLKGVDVNEARNFARKLLQSPALAELDRKSLMARVIKAHPETQDLVTGEAKEEKDETIVVSWESLKKRKAEFEDLVTNQIPQNLKDKKLAASYGDLRENFEYHAAKQKEAVLNRQRMEMEKEIELAQGTDFAKPDTSAVTIGTIVTLEVAGREKSYTILGAWDSVPEKNVVSYLSEVGRVLIGKKVGETVAVKDLESEVLETCTIKSIEAYNKG
ncbi:GreA/GreB family elongation factor [Roseibacillus ishigakijimensis]|uniref:GreA/GreB family elongation factor n=1 Tax=Roseibacillus ishigakijimensis TaxID=454146 RepID=A0A934RV86_9BACT|nr:GreA/GreB family elongation factor [Roseibacillus ishigakijimensis]MBK1835086.1 GreA/GreB family elongation factor [Roseibacillus ishigakijimensis]